jgi:hypothetical protein
MPDSDSVWTIVRPFLLGAAFLFVIGFVCTFFVYTVTNRDHVAYISTSQFKEEPLEKKVMDCEKRVPLLHKGQSCFRFI